MPLSPEKIEQIRKDALEAVKLTDANLLEEKVFFEDGYTEGATVEAEKAQCLIEALEWYQEKGQSFIRYQINNHYNAQLAVLKEWELDGGNKATAALQSYSNSLK